MSVLLYAMSGNIEQQFILYRSAIKKISNIFSELVCAQLRAITVQQDRYTFGGISGQPQRLTEFRNIVFRCDKLETGILIVVYPYE